jgi:hypothetical protein
VYEVAPLVVDGVYEVDPPAVPKVVGAYVFPVVEEGVYVVAPPVVVVAGL